MECRFINWVEPGLCNPSCGSGFNQVSTGFEVLENMAERRKTWTEAETAKGTPTTQVACTVQVK